MRLIPMRLMAIYIALTFFFFIILGAYDAMHKALHKWTIIIIIIIVIVIIITVIIIIIIIIGESCSIKVLRKIPTLSIKSSGNALIINAFYCWTVIIWLIIKYWLTFYNKRWRLLLNALK